MPRAQNRVERGEQRLYNRAEDGRATRRIPTRTIIRPEELPKLRFIDDALNEGQKISLTRPSTASVGE
ncbi:hypothetical protein VPNG_00585 [Cytospora leucostoma]|uniref:Uncharacterized protein n=1 Tax=Cytospora leucostoma TaxID=1230097 RepID=A0A423XLR8_9PEZI|nr:hypothetical protein VPNG_00585 [Cytospora leucostoma]